MIMNDKHFVSFNREMTKFGWRYGWKCDCGKDMVNYVSYADAAIDGTNHILETDKTK